MARARMLKAKFFTNEVLGKLPPLARLLFAGLWTLADREGRLEDRPERIRAEVLPYDTGVDADDLLDQLERAGFIERYTVDGERYVQVCKWRQHQKPHPHEVPSVIPPCDMLANRKQSRDIGSPTHDIGKSTSTIGDTCKPGSSGSPGSPGSSGSSKPSGSSRKNKTTAREARADTAPRFDARAYLFSAGIESQIAADWLTLRKAKKAGVTQTAIAGIRREAAKAGISLNDALRVCCERAWVGFRASWLDQERHSGPGPPQGNGAGLRALDGPALDALARELGISEARPGESMQAFIGRIQAAQSLRH